MTSSRDCDVMSRDQNFFMQFMTHARRLSIIQYNPHLSTVLRLAYTSYNSSMGKSVSHLSIYLSVSISIYLKKKMKNPIFDLSYLRNPLTQELKKFFMVSRLSQDVPKKIEVSTISGTWLTRGLKMAKLAILFILYIIQLASRNF